MVSGCSECSAVGGANGGQLFGFGRPIVLCCCTSLAWVYQGRPRKRGGARPAQARGILSRVSCMGKVTGRTRITLSRSILNYTPPAPRVYNASSLGSTGTAAADHTKWHTSGP